MLSSGRGRSSTQQEIVVHARLRHCCCCQAPFVASGRHFMSLNLLEKRQGRVQCHGRAIECGSGRRRRRRR
jgi:hypothetical protein